jgi:hypothetical protein
MPELAADLVSRQLAVIAALGDNLRRRSSSHPERAYRSTCNKRSDANGTTQTIRHRRVTVRRITPLLTGQNQAVPLAPQ